MRFSNKNSFRIRRSYNMLLSILMKEIAYLIGRSVCECGITRWSCRHCLIESCNAPPLFCILMKCIYSVHYIQTHSYTRIILKFASIFDRYLNQLYWEICTTSYNTQSVKLELANWSWSCCIFYISDSHEILLMKLTSNILYVYL